MTSKQEKGIDGNDGSAIIQSVTAKIKKETKTILHPMSVDFPEGKITAILGPSGSGKTTLLDFLTGSLSGVSAIGDVKLSGSTSYVPQDDRLHGFYTCREYMHHYARLASLREDSAHTTLDQSGRASSVAIKDENGGRDGLIKHILDNLGLSAHQDTIVGDLFLRGLSGGQKRRLSVALEAMSSPVNLFLDEPTSGLDSESAYQLIKFLKGYVREAKGRRVILTIHQPSSFVWEILDNIVLLSKGKLIYQGTRDQIEPFFAESGSPTPAMYNPADHYLAAVNDEYIMQEKSSCVDADDFLKWKEAQGSKNLEDGKGEQDLNSQDSSPRDEIDTPDIATSRGGGFFTFVELTRRYFKNLFFNPGILGVRVAMYSMLGLVIAAIFWDLSSLTTATSIQSRIALLFYCVAFFVFMSVAVLPFTVIERAIVEKEVRNGYYHPALYVASQAIASLPGTGLLAFVTTVIICYSTGLREPYWYFLNMFLALNCAEALAQLFSHVVPHFIIAMALIAAIYGLFMLLQGFMLVPSEFPDWLSWSHYVAFHTYSWRTFMYKEFSGQSYPDAASVGYGTGELILEQFEIEDVVPWKDMVILMIYAAVIHTLSFIVVHVKWLNSRDGRGM